MHKLFVSNRRSAFKGMLSNRRFNIVLVSENSSNGSQAMQPSKSIEYHGNALTVELYMLSVQHFLDLLPKILLQAFILNDFYVVVESEDEAPYTRIIRHIGL